VWIVPTFHPPSGTTTKIVPQGTRW
jgi:hypothetical protein